MRRLSVVVLVVGILAGCASSAGNAKAFCDAYDNAVPIVEQSIKDSQTAIANADATAAQTDIDQATAAFRNLEPQAPPAIRSDFSFYVGYLAATPAENDKPSNQARNQAATVHLNDWVKANCGFDGNF